MNEKDMEFISQHQHLFEAEELPNLDEVKQDDTVTCHACERVVIDDDDLDTWNECHFCHALYCDGCSEGSDASSFYRCQECIE